MNYIRAGIAPSVGVRISAVASKYASPSSSAYSRQLHATVDHDPRMETPGYACSVDAEPLHRYRPGGYHPVLIGDVLHSGRYRISHKLGWGGYSTVWAARDEREQRYVAVKIAVAEKYGEGRELKALQALSASRSQHPGSVHLISMLSHFQVQGPNGIHNCFVQEIMGPSIPDILETRFHDERLPRKLAQQTVRQALLGLAYLHEQGIAHGDIHARNLAFAAPNLELLNEQEFSLRLKQVETGSVTRKDGKPIEPGIPEYLVWPTIVPIDLDAPLVKIIDFGEAFLKDDAPHELRTPLVVRAPEAIFMDKLDYRVDLWSMGCMIFELVTGQPPFDNIMITPRSLVEQMLETTREELPERWRAKWSLMNGSFDPGNTGQALQEWLDELYFDEDRPQSFSKDEIQKIGELIKAMLRLEPGDRVSASETLRDPWVEQWVNSHTASA